MTCCLPTFAIAREARAHAASTAGAKRVRAVWCDACNGFHPEVTEVRVATAPAPVVTPAPTRSEPPAAPQRTARPRCAQTGKASYAGPSEAKRAAVAAARGHRVRPYRCEHCGRWHVTASSAEGGKGRGYGRDRG